MNSRKLKIYIAAVFALFAIYETGWAFHVSKATGVLQLNSSNPAATLSIIQPDHQITNVGTGKIKIRLYPGTYQLIATFEKNQAIKTAQIKKGESLVISLEPNAPSPGQQTLKDAQLNTLVKLLPYSGPSLEYKINYFYKFSKNFAQPVITITSNSPEARTAALNWIKRVGFDPSQLDIVYYKTPRK
jgi:hypothetical protein